MRTEKAFVIRIAFREVERAEALFGIERFKGEPLQDCAGRKFCGFGEVPEVGVLQHRILDWTVEV